VTSNLPADEVVWVRVLLPDDHQRLRAMFSWVSSETIYRRFHTPYPRVPEWIPEFLMDADERGGRSLVAVVGEEIVGHAMCSPPEAGEAEVAIVVEDRWQGRGVGKLLLFELAEDAKGQGVEAFVGIFLVENRVVPRLVDSVFSDARYSLKEGTRLARASLASLKPLRAPEGFDRSHEELPTRDSDCLAKPPVD
jgi:GNAT superfamily N-acetyltransferase